MTTDNPIRIKIPTVFFDDHRSRECVEHTAEPITKRLTRHYIVELDTRDAAGLMSDALHYSNADLFNWALQGLVSSARATVQAIRKQHTYDEVRAWYTAAGFADRDLTQW